VTGEALFRAIDEIKFTEEQYDKCRRELEKEELTKLI
jgi:hypothetical protein